MYAATNALLPVGMERVSRFTGGRTLLTPVRPSRVLTGCVILADSLLLTLVYICFTWHNSHTVSSKSQHYIGANQTLNKEQSTTEHGSLLFMLRTVSMPNIAIFNFLIGAAHRQPVKTMAMKKNINIDETLDAGVARYYFICNRH